MRLKLFDTIDEALALLEENNAFYHEVEKDIRKALKDLFANKTEMIVDVNSSTRKDYPQSVLCGLSKCARYFGQSKRFDWFYY